MNGIFQAPYAKDYWAAPAVGELPPTIPLVYLPDITQETGLYKISSQHGRNITLTPGNQFIPIEPFLNDEFGNSYGAVSIKGTLCHEPEVSTAENEPNGVKVHGMQDAAVFERTRKASQLLRQNGLLAEYVALQVRPTRFPIRTSSDMEVCGLREFKRHALTLPNSFYYGKKEVLRYLKLGATVRSFLSPVRTEDATLMDDKVVSVFTEMAIRGLQKRGSAHRALEDVKELNPSSSDDKEQYRKELLPRLIGENYAMLHELGVIHVYPYAGNISLGAEIVDTDSVTGKGLFDYDDAIKPIEIIEDLSRLTIGQAVLPLNTNLQPGHLLESYALVRRHKMKQPEQYLFDAFASRYIIGKTPTRQNIYDHSCVPAYEVSDLIGKHTDDLSYQLGVIRPYIVTYIKEHRLESTKIDILEMLETYEHKRLRYIARQARVVA